MDIVLQGKMTGIEAAQEIRNNLKIPVIFLTSLTGDATLEKAVAAEPFGYLLKPLDERALKVTIQMALFKHAMEEKLAESERKCKAIIDHSFEFIGMMKTDGTLIEANRSALKKLGINDSDVLGKPFWDTPGWNHSKELQDRLKEAVLQAASGKFVRFETWYPTVNGSDIYVDFSLKPVRDEQGNVLFLIPEVRDITEHKRAEEAVTIKALQLEMMNEYLTATEQELRATLEDMELGERKLRESEEHLRLLSDNLPNGMIYQVIIEKNGQRRFTYISAGVEQNHGVTAEDVLNDPMVLYNQFSEEDRVRVAEAEDLALKNRTVFDIEVMYRIPSGQLRWVHLRSVSRQLPGGTTIWDGFEIDITKSKQAEEALAITHSRLESAMMSGNLAWWEMDCVTGNVIFNERKAQMLGYPAEQFSHYTDFTSLVHPDDYDAMMQQMRDHLNGIKKQYNVNYRMRSQNGKYLWFHDIGGISEHAVDGSPLKVSGLVMDITQRKQEADALQKSEVQYRTLVENANEAILVMQDGMVRQPNRMSLEMSGYSE
ncbi:MAG: PAS domain S-box protein, partial [Methanomicrobiales archaeon]